MVYNSIFEQLKLKLPIELIPISGPILEMHLKPFAEGYILPMSFWVFTLHETAASWKLKLGSL
jgi:hypothetical protein